MKDYVHAPSKSPGGISFIRNRMFYARAALNAKGGVSFGLRHIRTPILVFLWITR